MIVRGVGRALAGLALVLGTVTACDDNPLSEDRDEAAYFRLNPSSVAVNAGGEVLVDAVLVNKFGGGLNQAVTGTPCDNKITAVPDSARSAFEFPERFRITGVTLGQTCLIVSGGGITDTVTVRVSPATINVAGADTVRSGESLTPTIQFLNEAGQPVTGLTAASVRWTSLSTSVAVVDSLTGVITGRAPGSGQIVATLVPQLGVTRVDTLRFVVTAGNFTGTVAPSPAPELAIVTFNAGAVPFDTDTNVTFDGLTTFIVSRSATQLRAVVPAGVAATSQFVLSNLGPNQVASRGSLPIINRGTDQYEPNNTPTTGRPIALGDTVYTRLGGTDVGDYFVLTITETTAVRFDLDWIGTADVDVLIQNVSGQNFNAFGCATSAHPEFCAYSLPAGTYYLRLDMYEAGAPDPTTVKFSVRRN